MYPSYKRIAFVMMFLLSAIAPVSSQNGLSRTSIKPPAQTPAPIQLTVTVTNKKGFVTGLNQNDFQISVDKLPARIVHFKNEDSPVSVGILLDASSSMRRLGFEKASERNLGIVQQALARFFELSNKSNAYFLVGFSDKPQLLADWTSDATLIIDRFRGLRPKGETALYDACYVGIEKLQNGRHSKRALILISDGLDNSSRYSYTSLQKLLSETGVLLYSISLPQPSDLGNALSQERTRAGEAILYELSYISGGVSYRGKTFRKQRDSNEIFETIAGELRNQYTIGIEPPNSSYDKKLHKIKVKVNSSVASLREMKALSARTREGYYWK